MIETQTNSQEKATNSAQISKSTKQTAKNSINAVNGKLQNGEYSLLEKKGKNIKITAKVAIGLLLTMQILVSFVALVFMPGDEGIQPDRGLWLLFLGSWILAIPMTILTWYRFLVTKTSQLTIDNTGLNYQTLGKLPNWLRPSRQVNYKEINLLQIDVRELETHLPLHIIYTTEGKSQNRLTIDLNQLETDSSYTTETALEHPLIARLYQEHPVKIERHLNPAD